MTIAVLGLSGCTGAKPKGSTEKTPAYANMLQRHTLKPYEGLENRFAEVDARRALTIKALERNEIKLPKNSDKIKEFVDLDEQFHGELVKLLQATEKHDQATAVAQGKKLLDMCIQCHAQFRA